MGVRIAFAAYNSEPSPCGLSPRGESEPESWSIALDDASAMIDLYVGKRYDLPLAVVPKTLVQCCVDIAMYQLAADAAIATAEQRRPPL